MFFEAGPHKVHIYGRSVPYRNHRSVQPQFGEGEPLQPRRSALYCSEVGPEESEI